MRLLIELAAGLSSGEKWTNLTEKHRIFSHRQGILRQFLSKHTLLDCLQLLKSSAEIDRIIKGALPGNVWHALQLFSLKI